MVPFIKFWHKVILTLQWKCFSLKCHLMATWSDPLCELSECTEENILLETRFTSLSLFNNFLVEWISSAGRNTRANTRHVGILDMYEVMRGCKTRWDTLEYTALYENNKSKFWMESSLESSLGWNHALDGIRLWMESSRLQMMRFIRIVKQWVSKKKASDSLKAIIL